MKETNRTNVAAYLAEQRHLRGDLRGAKTLTHMAAELGTTMSTVRRWLRRDHWELWMENWASVEEIWDEMLSERTAAGAAGDGAVFYLQHSKSRDHLGPLPLPSDQSVFPLLLSDQT